MNNITLHNRKQIPSMFFGSFQMKEEEKLYDVVKAAADQGIFGFDTSPSYQTEVPVSKAINRYISEHDHVTRKSFVLESKVDAWQMIKKEGDIRPFVQATLKKIDQDYFDVLLIHWPQPDYFFETWKYMEKAYEEGMVGAIGVCNCHIRHLKLLEARNANICPMIVQNEIHPLNTDDAVLEYCQKNGSVVQAYSPLCRMLPQLVDQPLLKTLAEKYGKSVPQIVLRWNMERGVVPIVKTSRPQRVAENVAAAEFCMEAEDVKKITALNEDFKIFLESRCCPGF